MKNKLTKEWTIDYPVDIESHFGLDAVDELYDIVMKNRERRQDVIRTAKRFNLDVDEVLKLNGFSLSTDDEKGA